MALEIKKVEYFNILIENTAGEAYDLLSKFAKGGIGLLAFKAIPVGHKTQFSLFPNDIPKMKVEAKKAGVNIAGPHTALIIKSNSDDPGECAGIFKKLSEVDIHVSESSGIADIYGSYGVVLYIKQEDCEKAIAALI